MGLKTKKIVALLMAVVLVGLFTVPAVASDDESNKDDTSAARMIVDAVVVRPLSLAVTVVGGGIFVLSLPFSLLGGNSHEAAQKLVVEPARYTFSRPLGEM